MHMSMIVFTMDHICILIPWLGDFGSENTHIYIHTCMSPHCPILFTNVYVCHCFIVMIQIQIHVYMYIYMIQMCVLAKPSSLLGTTKRTSFNGII